MVAGIEKFKEAFSSHTDKFILIGGSACDIVFSEYGEEFRATKDLDIVLIVEAIDKEFVQTFWEFVKAGKYKNKQKSTGKKLFYRFYNPEEEDYPYMLELFAQDPDLLKDNDEIHLTRLSLDKDVSSLSAILLESEYYQFMLENKIEINGLPIIPAEILIPLKARAFLDLTKRKEAGEKINSTDIKKHKNDVLRLFTLLSAETRISLPDSIGNDMNEYCVKINEEDINLDNLKIKSISLPELLKNIKLVFQLIDQD